MRPLAPADVFAFEHIAELVIAPAGGRVAMIRIVRDPASDTRRATLHLWHDSTGWIDIPDSDGASTPRFSPDGATLAALRRHDTVSTLLLIDTATATVTQLLATPAKLRELAWSPDGETLAFQTFVHEDPHPWLLLQTIPGQAPKPHVATRMIYRHDTIGLLDEGYWQTCLIPAAGGDARQITSGPWFSGFYHPPGLAWTPDGKTLLLAANQRADWDRDLNDLHIQAIDIATGAVHQLTDEPGAQAAPAISPDGAWLAYTAVNERRQSGQVRHVVLRNLATGETSLPCPDLDRPVDAIAWSADGSALYLSADGPGYRGVIRAPLAGPWSEPVKNLASPGIEMPYQGGAFSLANDGTLAYAAGGIDDPGQATLRGPNGDERVISALNAAIAAETGGFHPAERLLVPSSSDGAAIEGWLMLPKGTPPASGWPILLEIHGGPYAAYGARFSIKHQMLAAAGYAVLFANPRGSVGYGEKFAMDLHDRFPGPDFDDLMDILDAAIGRPDIDATRQSITGISGGGVLTLWAVGHTDRFRAAISIKPVVAWESWMLTADIGTAVGRTWLNHDLPWTAPEKFRALSPLAHLHAAKTPTMIMAGEADSRTPISEAEQAYAALQIQGIPTTLIRFPGASHSSGAMRPSHVAAEITCTLAWLARFG